MALLKEKHVMIELKNHGKVLYSRGLTFSISYTPQKMMILLQGNKQWCLLDKERELIKF